MSVSLAHIRSLDGSQHNAFEVLCCQLGDEEAKKLGHRYKRKGSPDGGLEAYWVASDGSETGIQAKFFTSSPQDTQFQQIDKSVTTALKTHPNLTKLIVCIPVDLPDARIPKQRSARDRWEDKAKEWTALSITRGRECKFVLWGAHEIHERLARPENRGRVLYFFEIQMCSPAWFNQRLVEQTAVAGPRYSPEIHTETPIAKLLLTIANPSVFAEEYLNNLRAIGKAIGSLHWPAGGKAFEEFGKKTNKDLIAHLESMVLSEENHSGIELPENVGETIREMRSHLQTAERELEKAKQHKTANPDNQEPELYRSTEHSLSEIRGALASFDSHTKSQQSSAASSSCFLITGEGGVGKTHVLLDLCKSHIVDQGSCLVAFGHQFHVGPIWKQIADRFGIQAHSSVDFFSMLSSVAEYDQKPFLLVLDGINESGTDMRWDSELRSLIAATESHPWLRVIVSVRTPFDDTLLEKDTQILFVRLDHQGFGEQFVDAALNFFKHYELDGFTSPPFLPEFQNGLFLHLYCRALKERGDKSFVGGVHSFNSLFKYVLRYHQKDLVHKSIKGIDVRGNQVEQALDQLADWMFQNSDYTCPRDTANRIIQAICPTHDVYDKTLLAQMISAGLLIETTGYLIDEHKEFPAIEFGFQRLGDYFIARRMICKHLETDSDLQFPEGSVLHEWVHRRDSQWRDAGIFVALSMILAEQHDIEITAIKDNGGLSLREVELLLESVVWRSPQAVRQPLADWVFKNALNGGREARLFLRSVLKCALIEGHPCNSQHLHVYLSSLSMSDRDRIWTVELQNIIRSHKDYADLSIIELLIRWCWRRGDLKPTAADTMAEGAARLALLLLVWCFTCSHREIRDQATKACVELIVHHPGLCDWLLAEFHSCNDPYVVERLHAIVAGAMCQSHDDLDAQSLLNSLYTHYYQKQEPPVNWLSRNYARRAYQYAECRGIFGLPPRDEMLGPFQSHLRDHPPAKSVIEKRLQASSTDCRAKWQIWSSLTYGDFGTYIMSLPMRATDRKLRRKKGNRKGISPIKVTEPDFLSCWVGNRVLQLGWDVDLFGEHDEDVPYMGRNENRIERIGKKYQWIAWRELLARFEDTYDTDSEDDDYYDMAATDDIDPSYPLRVRISNPWKQSDNCWWKPLTYSSWGSDNNLSSWIKQKKDIPNLQNCLLLTDPATSREALALSVYYRWTAPAPMVPKSYSSYPSSLYLIAHSHIVRACDAQAFRCWAKDQWFFGRWFPEGESVNGWIGEYPVIPQHEESVGWVSDKRRFSGADLPCEVRPLVYNISIGGGYDFSVEDADAHSMSLPESLLLAECELTGHSCDGKFHDKQGRLVFYDPSVFEDGPSTCFADKERLMDLMPQDQYRLFWIVLGEKIAQSSHNDKHIGRQRITGFYEFIDGQLVGEMNSRFEE